MLLRDRAAPEVPPEQRAGGKSWTYGSADGPGHLAQDISTWRLPALRAGPLMRSRHYYALFIARAVQLATSGLTSLGDVTLASDQRPSKIFVDQGANRSARPYFDKKEPSFARC